MKSNCIDLDIHNSIALIRLDLSEDESPHNPTPSEQLADVCQSLNEDPTVRAIIFTNTSETFWLENPDPFSDEIADEDPESTLQRLRVASHVANLNVPTIAAISGRAWNQGLELALACDLRIANEDATFGFSYLAEGFIPWDGGTQQLPRIIGRAHALDLLLTGRSLSAGEALEIGLLNAVTPEKDLENAAIKLARTIVNAAPTAVRYLKEAVHKGLDMPLTQGLNLEADLSFILQTTKDRQRGIQSFLTKTTPKFTGQ